MLKMIDRETLRAKLASGTPVAIAEALPEKYYRDAHLPGALNLPHDRVDALAPVLLPRRDAEIVVYCSNRSCQNSHIAALRLVQLGYTDVSVYAAGKQDWIEAGLALERSESVAA